MSMLLAGCELPATGASPAPRPPDLMVALKHAPAGTVTLSRDGATSVLAVHLTLTGLGPGSTHPAHIHKGTCAQQSAPVIYPLGTVTADDKGAFDGTFTVNGVGAVPSGEWFINVHTGPRLDTPDQYRAIACADIVHGGDTVAAAMEAVPGAGNNPAGTAAFTYNSGAGTLRVELKLTGLDPASKHAAEIRVGSCSAQGVVKYQLDDLVADAGGTADATTTVNPAEPIGYGLWYLEVHRGAASEQQGQQGSTPVACADVARGA